jgi:hypothetical protein
MYQHDSVKGTLLQSKDLLSPLPTLRFGLFPLQHQPKEREQGAVVVGVQRRGRWFLGSKGLERVVGTMGPVVVVVLQGGLERGVGNGGPSSSSSKEGLERSSDWVVIVVVVVQRGLERNV